LTNYQVAVAIFLGLAATAELPATEGRTAEQVAKMVVITEIAAL
jgi:hypothetical protein